MNIITISAICILAAIAVNIFKQINNEYSLFISIICTCIIASVALKSIIPVINEIESSVNADVSRYVSPLLKGLGISYIGSMASSICIEGGAKSIADKIELAAKVSITLLYAPIMLELLNAAVDMIKK